VIDLPQFGPSALNQNKAINHATWWITEGG
jgi:hypothetical protein